MLRIEQSLGVVGVRRRLFAGAAMNLLLLSAAFAQQAPAAPAPAAPSPDAPVAVNNQAISSNNVEAIVVTAAKQKPVGGGLITAIDAPKAASVVTQKFIQDQLGGANPYQLLELTPGVNATNRGPTGLDRGAVSIRGFEPNQLGVMLDGVPLNDSGTFNTFPQEYVDTENLSQIYLTPGAGDPDSPNIGATGGVISMVVRPPSQNFHVSANTEFGDDDFKRVFVRLDTGEFGGNNTAFISYSYGDVNTWRGIDNTYRQLVDAEFVHKFDNNNQISAALFFNNSNDGQYEALTKAQIAQYGYNFNYAPTFAPEPTPTPGGPVVNDNNSAAVGSLLQRSNFAGLYYNPFNFVVLSVKANLQLAPNVRFDFQPYLQYDYGACCVAGYLSDSNSAVLGQPTDLNHDGNTQDNTLYYNPGVQESTRPGFITRLKWTVGPQELIFGFHFESATLHEYQNYIPVNPSSGIPVSYWGDSQYELTVNGKAVFDENRYTYTTEFGPFIEDTIHLLDDKLILTPGFQFPVVNRSGSNLLPLALRTSAGQVAPTNPKLNQSMPLPNMGARYELLPGSELFASVARTFRATDNTPLYLAGQNLATIKPESAIDIEGGYRYHGGLLIGSITGYHLQYSNREQYVFDATSGTTVGKNIGSVSIEGLEAEVGTVPIHGFSAYVSGSLNTSSLLDNLYVGVSGQPANIMLPTKGKQLTDLPLSQLSGQFRYDAKSWFVFVQPHYTGTRYSTLVNDQKVGGYATWDAAAGFNIPPAWTYGVKTGIELSVTNLLDRQYLGGINFTNNANTVNGVPGSAPSYYQGAPRFISIKLRAEY